MLFPVHCAELSSRRIMSLEQNASQKRHMVSSIDQTNAPLAISQYVQKIVALIFLQTSMHTRGSERRGVMEIWPFNFHAICYDRSYTRGILSDLSRLNWRRSIPCRSWS
jgi:hypothetical protein